MLQPRDFRSAPGGACALPEPSHATRRGLDRPKSERHASVPRDENQPFPFQSEHQKHLREVDDQDHHAPSGRPRKRLRPSSSSPSRKQTFDKGTASRLSVSQRDHVSFWAARQTWPEEYFQENRMQHLLARPKLSGSLRRKRSELSLTSSATPSDQRPREEKSAPYRNASYETLLEKLGDSYMDEFELGVKDSSKALCEDLLAKDCPTPKGTLFRDDVFARACRNLRDKNESRIILDFARLLVPSPESLAAFGATSLGILVESVNAGWNNSIPITTPRPQPDLSVGFRESAFSDEQVAKIQPFLGHLSSLSFFRTTFYMFFPFLTCEVKSGAQGLNIADRQNAHSMTLAVRGIAELFKLGKRETELDRQLQTFSISHDDRTVRLYGYYPVLDGPKTKIYRHQIRTFDITELDGKEKWTTYKFTVAVYYYSLTLLQRLRSLIDDLPAEFDWEPSQHSPRPQSGPSGLLQRLENQMLAPGSGSSLSQVDSQVQQITPDASTQERAASESKNAKV